MLCWKIEKQKAIQKQRIAYGMQHTAK